MTIQFVNKKSTQIKADCEVIFVVSKNMKHKWVKDKKELEAQNFKGEAEEVLFLPHRKKVYIGVDSLEPDEIRSACALALRVLHKTKVKTLKIGFYAGEKEEAGARAIAEGFLLGGYSFNEYKSKKEKCPVAKVMIAAEEYENKKIEAGAVMEGIRTGRILAEATNLTRDIVNRIPAEVTPVKLGEIAGEVARKDGLEIKVYGEKYLEKEGMGAFLAVSKASPYPPQLIHLIHRPEKPKMKIALVGKGLTFDSGGLSLKPSEAMVTMKCDKSGASAIIGIMRAVSRLKLPLEVHGIIGATENVVGKHGYKPDDVLRAKNGKTIEVKNTDAEGRLVLADCLVYAQELKPDYIADLATLTGACMVALGRYTIGVMGHGKELKSAIGAAAEASGELAAELPFNKYLPKLLKSEVADISNVSSARYGGAITAALFLSEFIARKYRDKWVHLDIAGPAFADQPWGYNPYGGSGAGVRLITEWLANLALNS